MANHNIIRNVFKMKDKLTGIIIFQFVDGLWKAGNPEKQDIGGWAPNSLEFHMMEVLTKNFRGM